MSQSANLYRIDLDDFLKIIADSESFALFKTQKGYELFMGHMEGIRFVLSKNTDDKIVELANSIFYPASVVGEQIEITEESIFYHDPNTVKKIAVFLCHKY